eukprot:3668427-Amphidinium_carterae.1
MLAPVGTDVASTVTAAAAAAAMRVPAVSNHDKSRSAKKKHRCDNLENLNDLSTWMLKIKTTAQIQDSQHCNVCALLHDLGSQFLGMERGIILLLLVSQGWSLLGKGVDGVWWFG